MLRESESAVGSTPEGSLLVLSVGTTVSWVTTSANQPMSTRPMNQVSLTDISVVQHLVFGDRVLVLSADGDRLTSAVVWLNSGVAP